MKKILLVAESLASGGAERQLVYLSVLLKRSGYDVTVLTYLDINFYKENLDREGVPNQLYAPATNKCLRFYRLARYINQQSPDIVISFLPGPNAALCLAKALRLFTAPLVVSERSYTCVWSIKKKLIFSLYRFADAVIANSKAESDNIKMHNKCLVDKTSYIPNCVDVQTFLPMEREENEMPQFIVVARLKDYKNVKGLIATAHRLYKEGEKFGITWYGYSYGDGFLDEMKTLVREKGLDKVVRFVEPSNQIHRIYPKADALCLPSFFEGYPNVVIEAMSCQLPILCSNVCENPNIVIDGVNGFLFDPHDVNDMVNAFKRFLSLSSLQRKEMGLINRKRIMENNQEKVFLNRYIKLIDSMCN